MIVSQDKNCKKADKRRNKMKQVLNVEGMKCGGCATTIQDRIKNLEGVKDVEVSLDDKTATVSTDKELDIARLVEAFSDTKYKFS